jgi:hypothetical protein
MEQLPVTIKKLLNSLTALTTYLIESKALEILHIINIHPDHITWDLLFPESRSHLNKARLQVNHRGI